MRDTPKNVTGGCLCGKVRYEAQVFLKSDLLRRPIVEHRAAEEAFLCPFRWRLARQAVGSL
jgi:hypothetical protein